MHSISSTSQRLTSVGSHVYERASLKSPVYTKRPRSPSIISCALPSTWPAGNSVSSCLPSDHGSLKPCSSKSHAGAGRCGRNDVCFARAALRLKRDVQIFALAGVVTMVSCSRAWSLWPCET